LPQKSNPLQIDLLRHGELQTSGLFCADENEPLSDKGMQQLTTATQSGQWDVVISSPSRRCREFAETLSPRQADLIIDEDFQEMDFGRWVGVPYAQVWQKEPEQLQALWGSPETFIAPDGESMQHFIERVQAGWQSLLDDYAKPTSHKKCSILLITHAGVIRNILAQTLKIPHSSTLSFDIGYARFTRLHYYPDGVYSLREHGARMVRKIDS
jgi:broad specificity phosphatase PhoE